MATADKSLARKAARARVTRRRRSRESGKGGAMIAGSIAAVLLVAIGAFWVWGWSGSDEGQLELRTRGALQYYHDGLAAERPPYLAYDGGINSPTSWDIRKVESKPEGAVVTAYVHASDWSGRPTQQLVYFVWRQHPKLGWRCVNIVQ